MQEAERGDPQRGGVGRDCVPGGESGQLRQVEGAGLRVEPQHRNQQQSGGNEGVEEVLDGGAAALLAAAKRGDQHRHRYQRHLPERVVQEHVERDEDAHHRNLLQQEENVEELLALADGAPRDQHSERREQAGQRHQPHGEAIHTDVVVDGGRGDPRNILLELEGAGLARVRVVERQMQRQPEGDQRDGERGPLHGLAAVGQQRKQQRAGQRREDDEGQNDVVDIHHRWPHSELPKSITAITAAAPMASHPA